MAPTVEEVTSKAQMVEIDPKKAEKIITEGAMGEPKVSTTDQSTNKAVNDDKETTAATEQEPKPTKNESDDTKDEPAKKETPSSEDQKPAAAAAAAAVLGEPKNDVAANKDEEAAAKKEEKVALQTEPKTGVSFPVKLDDGKQLNSFGIRNKKILGLGIKIYAFGMFVDNEKLKEILRMKFGKAPPKPTKEMYQVVIDSDIGMMVRLVIVFPALTMNMVKKNFDEGLGAAIKKLNGGRKDDVLTNMVMGEASDNIKLGAGSVIEITRLPGNILQTKVKDEVVSKVQSELLCRAYFHMYLGEDAFDKDAKEKFGNSLLSLF